MESKSLLIVIGVLAVVFILAEFILVDVLPTFTGMSLVFMAIGVGAGWWLRGMDDAATA